MSHLGGQFGFLKFCDYFNFSGCSLSVFALFHLVWFYFKLSVLYNIKVLRAVSSTAQDASGDLVVSYSTVSAYSVSAALIY